MQGNVRYDRVMGEADREQRVTPMQSSVNWTLLGLIIERPSYAYELSQRFGRIYGNALSLSSVSHAYTAIGRLKDRGLVEEVPGTRVGRQPRPHYHATAIGLTAYHEWLIGQVGEERRRQKVFMLQLTALADPRDLERAMGIISDYEQACLAETCATPLARNEVEGEAVDAGPHLQTKLIAEQKRLSTGANIQWARFARSEIRALAGRRTTRTNGAMGNGRDEHDSR